MTLKAAAIVNGNTKPNRWGRAIKERAALQRALRNAKVDTTTKADLVRMLCQDYMKEKVDVVVISGGDGTVQNFMTSNFIENYRKFGKGMTPIGFARIFNRMALDPDSGVHLPALYHRKKGTVNFYAETLGMKGDLETIAENWEAADRHSSQPGTRAFPRVYVPVIMVYSKGNKRDLDSIHLMTNYGDGFAFNYYDHYYEPRKEGKDPDIFTAMKVIAKGTASACLDVAMDGFSEFLSSSDRIGRTIYPNRYVDMLVPRIDSEIVLDGKKLPYSYRTVIAIGTIGARLYGLKFFWRMPGRAEDFRAYFPPLAVEKPESLGISKYDFHFIGGNARPVELSRSIPSLLLGKKTVNPHLTDTTAKRIEIRQKDPLRFISDGSRQTNGNNCIIEPAYLQPFILLDQLPKK